MSSSSSATTSSPQSKKKKKNNNKKKNEQQTPSSPPLKGKQQTLKKAKSTPSRMPSSRRAGGGKEDEEEEEGANSLKSLSTSLSSYNRADAPRMLRGGHRSQSSRTHNFARNPLALETGSFRDVLKMNNDSNKSSRAQRSTSPLESVPSRRALEKGGGRKAKKDVGAAKAKGSSSKVALHIGEKEEVMRLEPNIQDLPTEAMKPHLCRSLVLYLLSLPPSFAFLALFTESGWGVQIFTVLRSATFVSRICLAGGIGVLLLLHLTDYSYWTGGWYYVKNVMLATCVLTVLTGMVTYASEMPSLPIILFLLSPVYFLHQPNHVQGHRGCLLLSSISLSLLGTGITGLVWFSYSVSRMNANGHRNIWPGHGSSIKCELYRSIQCVTKAAYTSLNTSTTTNQTLKEYTDNGAYICTDSCCFLSSQSPSFDSECQLSAFMIYTSLFVASVAVIVFSAVAHFLGLVMGKNQSQHTSKVLRLGGMLVFLGVVGMWCATEIAGASIALSNVVWQFSGAFLLAVGAVSAGAIGWQSLRTDIAKIPVIATMKGSLASDYIKAIADFLSPIYIAFLLLSVLNQFFRMKLTQCAFDIDKLSIEERESPLTSIARKQLIAIMKWEWTSVLRKTMIIGFAYWTLNVGASKLAFVFLSWLNTAVSGCRWPT